MFNIRLRSKYTLKSKKGVIKKKSNLKPMNADHRHHILFQLVRTTNCAVGDLSNCFKDEIIIHFSRLSFIYPSENSLGVHGMSDKNKEYI